MASFLAIPLQPSNFKVVLPTEVTGLQNVVSGTLTLSRRGYIYSTQSDSVLSFKLFALILYLPLKAVICKCSQIAKSIFGYTTPQKGYHDFNHIFHLVSIASKGLSGMTVFKESIEEFALAELAYNSPSGIAETSLAPRSKRFYEGVYAATCLQPLFHKDEYQPVKIGSLSKIDFQICDNEKKQIFNNSQKQKILTAMERAGEEVEEKIKGERRFCRRMYSLFSQRMTSLFFQNEFLNIDPKKLEEELTTVNQNQSQLLEQHSILKKEFGSLEERRQKQHLIKERCQKYALTAILNQECISPRTCDGVIETTADFTCCGYTLYREQKICGLLHKIDCCGSRCWAINCLCCVCCIFPEGRSVCCLC